MSACRMVIPLLVFESQQYNIKEACDRLRYNFIQMVLYQSQFHRYVGIWCN